MTRFGVSVSIIVLILLAGAGFLAFKVHESRIQPAADSSGSISDSQTGSGSSQSGGGGTEAGTGFVSGHVTIGPNCPVEQVDHPCQPAPEAYTSREAVVYASDAVTETYRTHLSSMGDYKVSLDPGNYFIQIVPAGIGPGEKKPVTIKSSETSVVDFDIDTGIR